MADIPDSAIPDPDAAGQYSGPRAADPPAHDDHDDPGSVTRTKFLTGVAMATGGVMGAAITVPVIGFAMADSFKSEEFRWVDVGPATDFLKGLPPYKDDSVVGNVTSIAVSGPDPEADRRVYVSLTLKKGRGGDGVANSTLTADDLELLAIWNRCAHLGCPVKEGGGVFACPCHGGAYDARGIVTSGPPPRPLDRFDVKITDGKADVSLAQALAAVVAGTAAKFRVLIGKPYSIDSDEKSYRLHLPGEPVDGILSNLYPL